MIAVTFSKSKDHSAPLMRSCNMLNIFDIKNYFVFTFVYECVKERISVCEDWFRPNIETFTVHAVAWVILCLYLNIW